MRRERPRTAHSAICRRARSASGAEAADPSSSTPSPSVRICTPCDGIGEHARGFGFRA